jgi:hypothetical protein
MSKRQMEMRRRKRKWAFIEQKRYKGVPSILSYSFYIFVARIIVIVLFHFVKSLLFK